MLEHINIHSNVAVYAQIRDSIRFAIASGALKGGDRLPRGRELAERLDINFNTVAKAYRDLEVMGYVNSRQGMGVFVNSDVEEKCRRDIAQAIFCRLHEVIAEAKAAGISKTNIQALTKKCLSLTGGPYEDPPKELLAVAKQL